MQSSTPNSLPLREPASLRTTANFQDSCVKDFGEALTVLKSLLRIICLFTILE
jgi:hypothetical protein